MDMLFCLRLKVMNVVILTKRIVNNLSQGGIHSGLVLDRLEH